MVYLGTYVEPFQEIGVSGVGALLSRVPKLLLGRVSVHGTYFVQTVPELLWRIVQVACLRTNDRSVVDQPKCNENKHRIISPSFIQTT